MTEYRITGTLPGRGDLKVYTEWFEPEHHGVATGVKFGAEMRGWNNVKMEERDDD